MWDVDGMMLRRKEKDQGTNEGRMDPQMESGERKSRTNGVSAYRQSMDGSEKP